MSDENKKNFKRLMFVVGMLIVSFSLFLINQHIGTKKAADEEKAESLESAQVGKEQVHSEKISDDVNHSEGSESRFYSQEDIKSAKKTATDFVKNIYSFDGKHPEKGYDEAKKYVTKTLKEMMEDGGVEYFRPTEENFSRSVSSIDATVPDDETEEFITIEVTAKGEIKSRDGKKARPDENTYLVRFEKENKTYKVADYVPDSQ
ncbi:hypothetical protein [Bacillus halotolerans]|uniref:hypothetical protein n=1 Tax=Bacillus halotolerans TaxID=260554 RepID=UPI0040495D46